MVVFPVAGNEEQLLHTGELMDLQIAGKIYYVFVSVHYIFFVNLWLNFFCTFS